MKPEKCVLTVILISIFVLSACVPVPVPTETLASPTETEIPPTPTIAPSPTPRLEKMTTPPTDLALNLGNIFAYDAGTDTLVDGLANYVWQAPVISLC